ncbi:MAG: T9SS type A sorting domain-containing protein [Chitinophagaceae bacterium]
MKLFMLLLLLWCMCPAKSQSFHPGGIKGAIQWYCTDNVAGSPGLSSYLNNNKRISVDNATIGSLNFHPSLLLSGTNRLRIELGTHDLRSASYFTVYQSLDTAEENSIWNISNDQKTSLILTTDRMADLSAYQYMNYYDVIRSQPKVNVYVQRKENDNLTVENQWWNIGVKPTTPQLPVTNFKGLVPEIIAYDRVLNSRERLQVASYLALKYGITLTEPGATYLNSNGDKIWDGYDYKDWHRNIAGICRDDSGGLKQTIASSSNMPGLLTIASQDLLVNNSFLLWGDNGKELSTDSKIPGLPLLLQKTWLMKIHGNTDPFKTDLVIDTKSVDAPLPAQPVFWLAIDPGGEGKFNSSTTEFIKMDKLDAQGKAFFNNVVWDKDGSGKDVWGIIAAQDLLLTTTINQPSCTSVGSGSLQVKIVGGQLPYQLAVQNNAGLVINKHVDDNGSTVDFTNLNTGKYFLKVIDASQHVYTDSFYINNHDVPLPRTIADGYTLPSTGKPLLLDAAEGMPDGLLWEWKGPENFQSFNPETSITKPGLYTIRCTKDGCTSEKDVVVKDLPLDVLYDVTVYPNPSAAAFRAKVTLDKPASVTMSVYTHDGKLVSVQKGENRANYLFTGDMKVSGVYELVFTSGLSKATRRIIIAK